MCRCEAGLVLHTLCSRFSTLSHCVQLGYLLSSRPHSRAQQPFHQFFLQHDGIHPKPPRHRRTEIATGLRQWKKTHNPAENWMQELQVGTSFLRSPLTLLLPRLCSLNTCPLFLLLSFSRFPFFSFFFSFPSVFPRVFLSAALWRSGSPCSDRYGGILRERERERGGVRERVEVAI